MRTTEALYKELDYWKFIKIADDIIDCPAQRPEYKHLVRRALKVVDGCAIEGWKSWVVDIVLQELARENKRPTYLRPTFYYLLFLEIKNWLLRLRHRAVGRV